LFFFHNTFTPTSPNSYK